MDSVSKILRERDMLEREAKRERAAPCMTCSARLLIEQIDGTHGGAGQA